MVLFNYSTRELTAKIVYYGPGICGKTTNLQFVHENLPGEVRGKMLSLATKTDRTLFFDFLPIDLGEIRGMKTRVQLYTVPGQVFYNETRKLVLKGVDGLVFVADSQETMLGANVESFKNLEENLKAHSMKLADIPHVIQFNKRDLPKLSSIEDMNAVLNRYNAPFYESVATTGIGVQDTLKAIVKLVLLNLTKKYETKAAAEAAITGLPPAPPAAPKTPKAPPPVASKSSFPAAKSPPPARAPIRVSDAPARTPMMVAEANRTAIPLSPIEEAPAPPKKTGRTSSREARKPHLEPIEATASFDEAEIDGLVGEVEEIPTPVAAAPAADEGAWMGEPEAEGDATSVNQDHAYGATVALDDLLEDRAPAPVATPPAENDWRPASASQGGFEVDRGFDPEWPHPDTPPQTPVSALPPAVPKAAAAAPAPAAEEVLVPIAPFPIPSPEAADGSGEDVLLTELASDADLFSDPSLEVARLADGQAREIVVPVMLGEGPAARRYKLAIRLRLDAVD